AVCRSPGRSQRRSGRSRATRDAPRFGGRRPPAARPLRARNSRRGRRAGADVETHAYHDIPLIRGGTMTLIDRIRGKYPRAGSRPAVRAARRRPLLVEGLEDRQLLTTLFTPHTVEQASDGGGARLGNVSWGMPLYTIYWGSDWATPDGQALQSQIQNSLN